jgi:hypothetical protein
MDYTQLLKELEQASLFDIYRLNSGMRKMLDQPDRINAIKRRLYLGMEITYFDEIENRLIPAVVEAVNTTRVGVRNKEDGQKWNIRFYTINLDGVDTDIHAHEKQVDRNKLKVGDLVGFYDNKQQEQYGEVIRLNPKTVTIHTKFGTKWRVTYSLLFKVMDGESNHAQDSLLIEGGVVTDFVQGCGTGNNLFSDTEMPDASFKSKDMTKNSTNNTSKYKAGRDDPCPCGSGKKFKKCCLE